MTSAGQNGRPHGRAFRLLALAVLFGAAISACTASESEVGSSDPTSSTGLDERSVAGSVETVATSAAGLLEVADSTTTPGSTTAPGSTTSVVAGSSTTTAVMPSSTGSAAVATSGSVAASGSDTTSASTRTPTSEAGETTTAATSRPTPSGRPKAQPGDPNDAYGGGGRSGCAAFPADNWWNTKVSALAVHERSADWVAGLGSANLHPDFGTVWDGKAIGIPFVIVDGSQPRVPVRFTYASESEPGPYPIPPDAPIEDGSDRHILVIDKSTCTLYELFDAKTDDGGASWQAGSGAVFDLGSNALRPQGWTSADAAGLPIYPGLVTYEEVVLDGRIDHALRFTASRTQRAYIRPATHWASSITDPAVAPLGSRFRLKSGFDCSSMSTEVQVICTAMKTYGMFLADNGADWHVSGAPDPRWNDAALADLRKIPGSAFEVVETGEPLTR